MAIGEIYVKSNISASSAGMFTKIAPLIIGKNGSVRFPELVPSPETVYQIQTANQSDDVQGLNTLLVKHRFYVLPGKLANW